MTTKTIHYQRPNLTDYQTAAFFNEKRFSVVEAGTKSGKTVAGIAWLLEQAMKGKSTYFWWCAPVFSQASIAYERMKTGLDRRVYHANDTNLTLRLPNGSVIVCKSAEKPDNLYGEDVGAAVIDEASRVREESFFAIRSTLTATKGPVRIIGNVKGRGTWFYKIARRAESDESMHHARITCRDAVAAGVLDGDEIDSAESDLPSHVFKELYMAEASDGTENPFGLEAIEQCIRPLSQEATVARGIDLAKHVDWTVNIGRDSAGVVSSYDRFQLPWGSTVQRLDKVVMDGAALVDSTGVGDPILEQLQAQCHGEYEGFNFSSQSKQKLMEGLSLAISQQRIGFPEGPIAQELREFEYTYSRTGVKYSAPDGLHDDCVCALALAGEHQQAPRLRWTVA